MIILGVNCKLNELTEKNIINFRLKELNDLEKKIFNFRFITINDFSKDAY